MDQWVVNLISKWHDNYQNIEVVMISIVVVEELLWILVVVY